MDCISNRSHKPLLVLTHVERWLTVWTRDALDSKQDSDAGELLSARKEVRRMARELLQSDLYGGPIAPETEDSVEGLLILCQVDDWLTRWLASARAKGNSESTELWSARKIVRDLMADVAKSCGGGRVRASE